jgi:release factor glutamine methyltransferase
MAETWTTRTMLAWMAKDFAAQSIPSARLDAELLVSHVLGLDRVRLYMELDRPLSAAELAALRALVLRRRQREPVAYLIGRREFYLRSFEVSPAVLIPRPDTETLIERGLALLPRDQPRELLDLCTGSGVIALTLAAERPQLRATATDLSPDALAIAARNAEKLKLSERVSFVQGDLFAPLPVATRYDLIVANPPYVPAGDLETLAPELKHEPRLALVAGPAGLDVLARLCAEVETWLSPGGALLFEVGQGQAPEVARMLGEHTGLIDIRCHKDLGDIERVVEAHRASEAMA